MRCDREYLNEIDEDFIVYNEYDEAMIGITEHCPGRDQVVVYSYDRCIKILMDGGLTREDAEEHMAHNVTGAWHGDKTPVFV